MTMTGTNSEPVDAIRRVTTPSGVFEIHSAGTHITAWDSPEFGPVLFVSPSSGYGVGTPIRGGIPLCFPWFGAGTSGQMSPSHGFGRLVNWRAESESENALGEWTVVHSLISDDIAGARGADQFQHPFEARHTATFSANSLAISLEVTNTGVEAFTFEEALHTYFAVGSIARTEVVGLENARYLDKVQGSAVQNNQVQEGPVRFEGEVDRVYSSRGTTTIIDGENQRLIRVEKANSATTVVWNPGPQVAASMSDLGDDDWQRFVCVESANTGSDAVTLAPGASHTLSVTYTVTRA